MINNSIAFDFEKCNILVVGDLMLDRYLWGDVKRISPEAPVPVFHIKRRSVVPGGAGSVVLNVIGLGASVTLLGVIGRDENGDTLKRLLADQRIRSILLEDKTRPTITKTRIQSKGQQLLRIDDENTLVLDDSLKTRIIEIAAKEIHKCAAVIFSDYGKGIFNTPGLTEALIDVANGADVPVIVDPKGKNWERYSGAACLTPNTAEFEHVIGAPLGEDMALIDAMQSVRSKYRLPNLLVTRGPLGMCLIGDDEEPRFIPSIAREVYDVSGAGDTVIATLAVGIASGQSYLDAARLANVAAGVVVGKLGTQPINALELKAAVGMNGERISGSVNQKAHSLAAATVQVQAWKALDQKIVFTNGCFDLLHPGHIHLLNEAKRCGDRLIVGLNSDGSVRRLKGAKRPILSESDRAAILGALDCVDLVIIFEEDTPIELIETLEPDVLVKGSDYRPGSVVGKKVVESYGGKVHLVPVVEGYSTTRLAEKVSEKHGDHNLENVHK
ncbi:MAG: bifunctional D-glycero-beta-D-manno-heptose-7-phosphate kinase/D-glycero-beta-D-manno-heptose 1-phosphate adenylyltransferase HldE [Desulfobacterales bacterium]